MDNQPPDIKKEFADIKKNSEFKSYAFSNLLDRLLNNKDHEDPIEILAEARVYARMLSDKDNKKESPLKTRTI